MEICLEMSLVKMKIPLPTIKGIPANFQLFRKGKLQKVEAFELWNGIWA
jgi:hypothetical protein